MIDENFVTKKRNTRERIIKRVILIVTDSMNIPDEEELADIIKGLDMSLYCVNTLLVYGMNKTDINKKVKLYCRDNCVKPGRGDQIIYTNEVLKIIGGGG